MVLKNHIHEARERINNKFAAIDYKWIALSNTTLGVLMASIDSSILLISLPAIFRGIGIDPLAAGEANYLLWTLMGYMVATSVLLVTFGRISDIFGRVRLYNAGFAIFSFGSLLLWLVPGEGNSAAMMIIIFRIIQAIGGAFLFANSAAIITDAFPEKERGLALGINQIAFTGGSFIGLLVGGILAPIDWRLVFLVSVPVGIVGTVWAYMMLKETAEVQKGQSLDLAGNFLFAGGLIAILVAQTYGISPYGSDSMGWGNPWVIGGMALGVIMLAAFVWHESRVKDPLFDFSLFKIKTFAAGNIAAFLSSLTRGGLQFLIIIWLQGIWLPLHGFSFEDTPLWSAIYMLPMTIMFMIAGPISGYFSDRHGARKFAVLGMLLNALGFALLFFLPVDFQYPAFALILALMGIAMGIFASPNTSAIMSSVPAHARGVASGMRATFLNVANTMSIALIFTLISVGLSGPLPLALEHGLAAQGVGNAAASSVASMLPPTSALFAMFLGYNPMATLLPSAVLDSVSAQQKATILGTQFFPSLLKVPFMEGIGLVFIASVVLSLVAAVAASMHEKGIKEKRAVDIAGRFVEIE